MGMEWKKKTCRECGIESEVFNFYKNRLTCVDCVKKNAKLTDLDIMRKNEGLKCDDWMRK